MRVGLIVNPVAGMGGSVGLHGTDGPDKLARAIALGATPRAAARTARALARWRDIDHLRLIAPCGDEGELVCAASGLAVERVEAPAGPGNGGARTAHWASALLERGVDLIAFAGGDGTARDVLSAVGLAVPVVGIPCGVKMHSGVFAPNPEAAGDLVRAFVAGDEVVVRDGEVVDLDDADPPTSVFHGVLRVPMTRAIAPRSKAFALPDDEVALDGVAREVARSMVPGHTYLVGPGTSTARVLNALGLVGSLLGFDVVRDGRLVARDANARVLAAAAWGATLIAGVIGGQGFLFGRGNQQLTPALIRSLDDIVVLAGARKLAALPDRCLHVDTGDAATDASLSGYRRVQTAPGRSMVIRVA